jgi:hypothetical protein
MIWNQATVAESSYSLRNNRGHSLLINKSRSHFLISRQVIDEVGYFDVMILGLGEEDGDTTRRYIRQYKRS